MNFDPSNKFIYSLPNDKNFTFIKKRLNCSYFKTRIAALTPLEIGHLKLGSVGVFIITSGLFLWNYRQEITQKFTTGNALNKFANGPVIVVNNEFPQKGADDEARVRTPFFYRLPEKIYRNEYRFRRAMMIGHFDHTKEILFPKVKGSEEGYQVITPFYYYLKALPDVMFKYNEKGAEKIYMKTVRAAMAVDRGWIPKALYDRRLRPHDLNTVEQQTIFGTLRLRDKTPHQFTRPNDPKLGVWNNFSLEDFALYWQLPNVRDAKYVHFQEIDFGRDGVQNKKDIFPIQAKIDESIVEVSRERGVHLDKNYNLRKKIYGTASAVVFYIYALAA